MGSSEGEDWVSFKYLTYIMENQIFKEWFKKLYETLDIFRRAKADNGQSFVDELNKVNKSLIDKHIKNYEKGKIEKVKKIRVDILKYLKNGKLTLDIIENIKKQEREKYDHNILQSWTNFSILYRLYAFFNTQPNDFLQKLNEELVKDLWLGGKADINKYVFDAWQNFWNADFWTEIYNNSHNSQKTALQLYIASISQDIQLWLEDISIWMWRWPKYNWNIKQEEKVFALKDLTYEKILEEFQKYKDNILEDLYTTIEKQTNKDVHYRLYAPGENARKREEFYDKWIMALWWDELWDLNQYNNKEEIANKLRELDGTNGSKKNDATANYEFKNVMSIGDIVIPKKWKRTYLWYWIVEWDYIFDDTLKEYKSIRKVKWRQNGEWNEDLGWGIVVKTLTDITKYPDYVDKLRKLLWIPLSPWPIPPMNSKTNDLNSILYGAPGTGKTYYTINYALSIIENKSLDEINREDRSELKRRFDDYKAQGQIVFCTFHQSLSYEEFIEWIRANSENGTISYDVGDGIFKSIANVANKNYLASFSGKNEKPDIFFLLKEVLGEVDAAHKFELHRKTTKYYIYDYNDKTIYLELEWWVRNHSLSIKTLEKMYLEWKNNIIFSWLQWYYEPLLQLIIKKSEELWTTTDSEGETLKKYVLIIDEINRGNMSKIFGELITLLEPSKRLWAEEELKVILPYSQDEFGVPQNLYVLWTMNTADRSIALIDIALRRRFTFKEIEPDSNLLDFKVWNIDIKMMFETINQRIEFLYDRDHKLWHSFFMSLKKNNTLENLNKIFANNIIPLLQEYFYEDWEKIQIVLWDHNNQKTKEWKNKLIQEQIQRELNIIGFNHEDMEDKAKYTVNTLPNEKSYLWIYSKTINEETE